MKPEMQTTATDNDEIHISPNQIPPALSRNVFLARCLLFWEAFWPSLWPLIGVITLFAITALTGIWVTMPLWAKVIGLAGFAIAISICLLPLVRLSVPGRGAALRHLELRSGIAHRPATAYSDPLALGEADKTSEYLWVAHRARLAEALKNLRPGWPRSRLVQADSFALRVPLALALVIAVAYAGSSWPNRLASPFQLNSTVLVVPIQIDAWISPPAYTGRPPIFLTGQSAATPDSPGGAFLVPVGSEFVLRAQGERLVSVGMRPLNGASRDPASSGSDFAVTAPGESIREYRANLTEERHITILDDNRIVDQWRIEISGDAPPEIRFSKPPERSMSGSLKISYDLKDDYGIVIAGALVERQLDENSGSGGDGNYGEPLIAAPQFTLSLPQMRTRSGKGQTYRDLTAHPWAGTDVVLTLRVEDDAGQIGISDRVEFVLPSRSFSKPMARAIIEQRRYLALDINRVDSVAAALDALTLEPQKYVGNLNVYLAIRSARWRLKLARSGDIQFRETLLSVIDQLWQIALHIEDGNLSDAEQELRAAQEALQRALAENAPPDEIQRLMQNLRGALEKYMQALADNIGSADQNASSQFEPDQQTISQSDLERMLDNIENMARNGARDQAQQLLSQLQDILENLRAGQAQARSPEQQMMSQSLEELGELMDRQRQLMDETFRQDQQRSDGEKTPSNDTTNAEINRLRQEQAQLQALLDQLMEQMQEFSAPPSSEFEDAKGNMGEAIDKLGQGEAGPAASEQGEALENLRAGAKALAEQLAESQAQAGGRQGAENVDPLGRTSQDPDLGQHVKIPDEIDIQRAREILQELRRRLGEPHRPKLELDYFERLLRRF